MWSVYRKELNHFLSSITGYLAICIFLVIMGLFIWVLPQFNVLDYGYAGLETFFELAPYVFIMLIPAITMRSLAEEQETGTLELLLTKPIGDFGIVMGKWLAAFTLVLISLIPTLLYYFSIVRLGQPIGNIDSGGFFGSYLGLLLVAAAFVSIGMFTSALTKSQIVAFLLAAISCFILFVGFELLADFNFLSGKISNLIDGFGMNAHYSAMSRGVLDSKDVAYFFAVIVAFIAITKTKLEARNW